MIGPKQLFGRPFLSSNTTLIRFPAPWCNHIILWGSEHTTEAHTCVVHKYSLLLGKTYLCVLYGGSVHVCACVYMCTHVCSRIPVSIHCLLVTLKVIVGPDIRKQDLGAFVAEFSC